MGELMTLREVTARALAGGVSPECRNLYWDIYLEQAESILPSIKEHIAAKVSEEFMGLRESFWGDLASQTVKEMK